MVRTADPCKKQKNKAALTAEQASMGDPAVYIIENTAAYKSGKPLVRILASSGQRQC